tara:strand:- start:106 stop:390 length:285 start_codon:yes stop_codon:yes gene_type:complete
MVDHENDGQIAVALAELTSKIQMLLDKQEELAENVTKIKEAVYNPDEGLYARLKDLDMRLASLEAWKNSNAKVLWVVITVGAGLLTTSIWQAIF